jgi:deoxyribodipyrimidine photo-lyase
MKPFLFTKKRNNKIKNNKTLKSKLNNNIAFHIFHSDLTIIDNTSLYNANMPIIPIFIFTQEQLNKSKVFNPNSIHFLYNSLKELNTNIKKICNGQGIVFFVGKTDNIIQKLKNYCNKNNYDMYLFQNDDFSEYSIKRDQKITKILTPDKHRIFKHKTLCDIDKTYRNDAGYYAKFTPFYNFAKKLPIRKAITKIPNKLIKNMNNGFNIGKKLKILKFSNTNLDYLLPFLKKKINSNIVNGGRSEGIKLLKNLKLQKKYSKDREILTHYTSLLSAHHKFGTITIRETYEAAKKNKLEEAFIRQLYWRDFYYSAALLFKDKYPKQSIYTWQNDLIIYNNPNSNKEFNAWKKGLTGFPVVDAAMRQIANTGYMQNRMRMLVVSVLTKLMFVNWRKGERYFASVLNDYDFCMNFGNWCNVIGNMVYAQPPFRVFNPWIQGKKYDNNCEYIKKWVPELKNVDPNDIHKWFDHDIRNKYTNIKYPAPILDYKKRRELWMKHWKSKI